MPKATIPLNKATLIAGGAFLLVFALPKLGAIVASLEEPPATGGPVEAAPTTTDPSYPDPSTEGAGAMGTAIQVRATYLLAKAQQTEDAMGWATDRQNDVLWEVNQYRAGVGAFAGDAQQFSRLANLSAELAAVELVKHWLTYPSDRNDLPSIPINQPLETFVEGEVTGYGNQL